MGGGGLLSPEGLARLQPTGTGLSCESLDSV